MQKQLNPFLSDTENNPVMADDFDVVSVIEQLRREHGIIASKTIPETESLFLSLFHASTLQESLSLLIAWKWFSDFSEKIRTHFEMEERFVFPFLLGKADAVHNEAVMDFIRHHHSFEEQLREYIVIIQKSLNDLRQDLAFRMLIHKLERLEQDLLSHGETEHVLMKWYAE